MAGSKGFKVAAGGSHSFLVKKAKLAKVEILDGAQDKFLTKNGVQFVNLDTDAKWVDNTDIKNEDRLGYEPRLYVEFDLPGVSEFTLKAVPDSKNETYTCDEESRNNKFTFLDTEKTYHTESNGKLIITDAYLTVGGKNKFHFEVSDTLGNTLSSKKLETQRRIFIQEIKMLGDAGKSAASSISTVEKEFKKQGFLLETLPSQTMKEMENIGASDSGTYTAEVRKAYAKSAGKKKEPHTLVVGYTSHLAVKNPSQTITKTGVTAGPGEASVTINIVGPGLTNPAVSAKPLWQEIVTGESWFVKAEFIETASGAVTTIAEADCKAIPVNAANPHFSIQVKVDVSKVPSKQTGKIELTVDWVDRMRAGLSFTSNSLICVCTKGYWQTKGSSAQNEVIIHEMGHKIGMVPDGTSVDKTTTFYDSSKGHVGTHCHKGIPAGQPRYDSPSDAASSKCVMYGSTNGHSAFCDHCSVAAKKQDVLAGWPTV